MAPPINYTLSETSSQSTISNSSTIRTNVPGRPSSSAATGFPLKLEQIQNVNTKNGIPNNNVLKFNKQTGMWDPVIYVDPQSSTTQITRRFLFTDSLEWLCQHDMQTTSFNETLVNANGTKFSAKTRIIDENAFVVQLTSAESGWIDVTFSFISD